MAYEIKLGQTAVDNATSEKPKYDKVVKTLKSGTAFKLRVLGLHALAEVEIHSVYEVFNSTPCTKDDLYDKAVKLLRADQKALADKGDEKGAEAIGKHAYALTAKPRYLFGFIDLADGKPMVIDLSKKQAQGVIATIKKYEKRLNQLAFEISKTGTGQSTTVGFNPLMFLEEDLTPQELKHYQATENAEIPAEVYANCLYVKSAEEQVDDVLAYERKNKGLNLAERLGLNKAGTGTEGQDDNNNEGTEPTTGEGEGEYGF
jgi:hypothetical protein